MCKVIDLNVVSRSRAVDFSSDGYNDELIIADACSGSITITLLQEHPTVLKSVVANLILPVA